MADILALYISSFIDISHFFYQPSKLCEYPIGFNPAGSSRVVAVTLL
jgi:hypothetical protein